MENNKYSFLALFKGVGKPKATMYHAPSNNKAHKLRTRIIAAPDVLYVSPIQKPLDNKMPMAITLDKYPELHPYFGFRRKVK